MNYFFPKNINDMISDPKFRQLFTEAPLLASTGAYYGFPICCVEFFCNHKDNSFNSVHTHDKNQHPMHGTGYVPCPDCVENSKDKDLFSRLINEHRYCPTPFPSQSDVEHSIYEDLHKFFAFLAYKMYRNPLEELKKYSHLSYIVNEILSDSPIYLYYKGYKINVTAIGINNKQDFGYMVENNAFCANQLENLLEWHQIQEASSGSTFDYSGIWDCICKAEFDIVQIKARTYETVKPTAHSDYASNDLMNEVNIEQHVDDLVHELEHDNHHEYSQNNINRPIILAKKHVRTNHFSTI